MKLANQRLHQIAEHFFIEGKVKQKNLKLERVCWSRFLKVQWNNFTESNRVSHTFHLEFEASIEECDVEVLLDVTLLSIAVQNLLRNARNYTQEGKVKMALVIEPERIGVEVSDTGCGMDRSMVRNVFEKYSRGETELTRQTEGLGLGLYLAQEIAKQHGGEIEVVSKLGVGSTFTLWIEK